jgi:hypothetical protein
MVYFDVSVIIPTYNRESYLKQAIASCFDGNDNINVEVIVVDDGSTDGTQAYLKTIESEVVKPIFQEHQGPQLARNLGLNYAKGEFVKFLDDDDWLVPGALTTEVESLRNSDADLCYGSYNLVSEDGNLLEVSYQEQPDDLMSALLRGSTITRPLKFTYRRSLIEGLIWEPTIPVRQDLHYVITVALREPKHVHSNTIVANFRTHSGPRQSQIGASETNPPLQHARILQYAVAQLQNRGTLSQTRKLAAAQGLWGYAHLLAAFDIKSFESIVATVEHFFPSYLPYRQSSILSFLDRVLTPRVVEYLLYPLRKIKVILN